MVINGDLGTRILPASLENIRRAAQIVAEGGLIIYPTETVYGIGCDPLKVDAVKRLIEAKGRGDKPLPVLAFSIEHALRIAILPQGAEKLASKFWPGPLTMVLKKREILPGIVTANRERVGVRIPDNEVTLLLLKECGGLLIGTSANRSGKTPPCTAVEAKEQLGDFVQIILDGGRARIGRPSTVVDVTASVTRILREGPVSRSSILRIWQKCDSAPTAP